MLKRISPEWKKALEDLRPAAGWDRADRAGSRRAHRKDTGGAHDAHREFIVTEKRAVKVLRIDGVTPSAKALAGGAYRHYEPIIVATLPRPTAAVERFVTSCAQPPGARCCFARSTRAPRPRGALARGSGRPSCPSAPCSARSYRAFFRLGAGSVPPSRNVFTRPEGVGVHPRELGAEQEICDE